MSLRLKPALVLTVAALMLTSACGGGDSKQTVVSQTDDCKASGSGTTDLKVKPKIEVPKDPAPAETTLVEIVCGTGAEAKEGSAVEVKYVGGFYADGKEFDSSWSGGDDKTLPFTIGSGVIPGFSKGTTGMKVGGRRAVMVPSKDGYGEAGIGPIPGGATLIFIIDLAKIG